MTGLPTPRWAIISAVLSPLVLTAGWLVAGRLQPASYNPVRQTVSVMAGQLGADRWVMTAALLGVGACYLITAAGLRAVGGLARVMLIVAGACSLGIAASPEPASGPSAVHLAFTSLGAVMIATWPAVACWRRAGQLFLLTTRGSAVVTACFLAMLAWTVVETHGGTDLGLAERLTASVQTTWPCIVALLVRWPSRPGSGAELSSLPSRHDDPSGVQPVRPGGLSGPPPADDGPSPSRWPLARS